MKHKRIISLVLTVAMMLSMCMTGFAVNTSETDVPAICTCETQCTEGTVNSGCSVCGENDADLNSCKGEEITSPEPECTCETQCTEGAVNADCPVCGENGADLNSCKGEEITLPEPECTCETKCAEGAVNTDCPVCSADGADLEACKGAEAASTELECTCETKCTEGAVNADCPVCSTEGVDGTCEGKIQPAHAWNSGDSTFYDLAEPIDSEEKLKAALADDAVTEITLASDITLTAPLEITREVVINGGGYTISADAEMAQDSEALISITEESGNLTMQNVTLDGKDRYRNIVCAGTMHLDDVIVQNGAAEASAGILAKTGAEVTLEDVLIQNNTASKGSAGLGIEENAVVTMTNCRVTENQLTEASSAGGGITCAGTLTMNGGRIDHNHGAWYAGGILVSPGGTFTMQGTAKIYANELNSEVDAQARDVYAGENASVTLTKPDTWGEDVIGLENWYWDSASARYPEFVRVMEETDYQDAEFFMATVGTVFTVTFDANDGLCDNGEEIEERLVWHNETGTPNEYFSLTGHVPANPTRDGYKFIGWYNDDKILNPADQVTEDITYTAEWVPENQCVLTFDTNGGTPIAPVAVEKGESVDLSEYTTTWDGHLFAGWYLDKDLERPADTTIVMDSDETVYAKWSTSTVTVTYDPLDGTWTDNSTGNKTEEVPLSGKATNRTDLTKAGYRLAGWSLSKNGTLAFDFDTPITKPITLYAIWKDANKVTVTFDANGGSWHHTYDYYKSGTKIYENQEPGTKISDLYGWPGYYPTVTHFDREHYFHLGWSTDPNAETAEYDVDHEFIVPDHDVTYYAVWRSVKGTIRFAAKKSGQYMSPEPKGTTATMYDVTYDTDRTLSPNGFTRWGYEFSHWSTKPGYDDYYPTYQDQESAKGIITSEGLTVTLYATYKAVPWPVRYELEGVNLVEGKHVTETYYGSSLKEAIYITPDTENGYTIGSGDEAPEIKVSYVDENNKTKTLPASLKQKNGQYFIDFSYEQYNVYGPVTVKIKAKPKQYSITFKTADWWYSYIKNPETDKYTASITMRVPHGKTLEELELPRVEVGNMAFPTVATGQWKKGDEYYTLDDIWITPVTSGATYILQTKTSKQTKIVFKLDGGTTSAVGDDPTSATPYILIDPPENGTKKLGDYEKYKAFTSVVPEKPDYLFSRWKAQDGSSYIKAEDLLIDSNDAGKVITVSAEWGVACNIVFHMNGGNGGPENFAIPILNFSGYGQNIAPDILAAVNQHIPTKEGYWFGGWSYTEYPEEMPFWYFSTIYYDDVIDKYDSKYVSEDGPWTVDVYALWVPNNLMKLDFDTKGGTPVSAQYADPAYWFTDYDGDRTDYTADLNTTFADLALPDNSPTKEGYIFEGWYWDFEDYLLKSKEAFAQYTEDRFEYDEVQKKLDVIEQQLAEIRTIKEQAAADCQDDENVEQEIWEALVTKYKIYKIGDWGKSLTDIATTWRFWNSWGESYDKTLTAKWKPDPNYIAYAVVFEPGEYGTLSGNTEFHIAEDASMEEKGYAVPTVNADQNYKFIGWTWTDKAGNERLSTSEEVSRLTVTCPLTFTATYSKISKPYQVTFEAGEHGSLSGQALFTVDEGKTLQEYGYVIPTITTDREYKSVGWQGDDGNLYSDADILSLVINQNRIFTAQYEKDSDGGAHHPEIDPDDKDDDDDDKEEITEDEEVPLAETPWLNTEDHYAYIIGYSEDGTVRPNANITRAEVATIFFRLLTDEARDQFWSTSNNFSDVASDAWYNNAVSTMVNAGIIQGYEDGTFRPNNNITRAEFAAIASRFMSSGYDVEEDLFTDIAAHWARESINDAAMAKWISGYPDGTFLPDKAITRAEAVTLVNNVLQRKPHKDHMLDSMIKWPDNPESAWYYEAIQEATNSHDYDLFEGAEYETWTALQENRDWAALEKDWVNVHRTGGEVM